MTSTSTQTIITSFSQKFIDSVDWSQSPLREVFKLFHPANLLPMSRAILAKQIYTLPIVVSTLFFEGFPTAYRDKYLGIMAEKIIKKFHGKPIARISSQTTRISSLFNTFFGRFRATKELPPRPIFNADLTQQIETLIQTTKTTKEINGYFQNVILHGEPGTGKTMLAEQIAKSCDLDYVFISAADLEQYDREAANEKFNELLNQLEKNTVPTIVFIDEADLLFKPRHLHPELKQPILASFLVRTGNLSNKVMFVLATNFLDKIDNAVKSRMSQEILIPLPDLEERIRILIAGIEHVSTKSKTTELLLKENEIKEMAEKTKYCSARDLQQIVNLIHTAKYGSPTKTISDVAIADIVNRKVNQAQMAFIVSLAERGLLPKESLSQNQ